MINQTLWIGASAVVVGLVVRAINTDGMSAALTALAGRDTSKGDAPVNVPPALLPWLALIFGAASAALNALVNGADIQTALAGGFVSAATAVLGHSLGKGVPGVRALVRGRSSRLGSSLPKITSILLLIGAMSFGLATEGCPSGATSPTVDAEAGIATVTNGCQFLEGIDDSGVLRTICATVEEIAQAIAFITSFLRTGDAGAPTATCALLPGTKFCATSAERAKAVLFIVGLRNARLMLDGGAK